MFFLVVEFLIGVARYLHVANVISNPTLTQTSTKYRYKI
jgi:hypothetical protein